MKEDPTAADTVSSPIKNFPLDTVIDPRQKEYQIRRRNRRLGWSMDQLKNGCKGLIAANTEETFDDDDKQLIADTAFWAEKLLKEVEMMEKCVMKVGNIYAFFLPTKEDNDPSIFHIES